MKKLFTSIILFIFIINMAAYAEDRKLILQSDIKLSDGDSFSEDSDKSVDPMKWNDNTRFAKPKTPVQQEQAKPAASSKPAQTTAAGEKKCYYVISQVTSIRSTPSFLADRIGIYKHGNMVCEQNRIGDWIDTGTGWVNTKTLSTKNPNEETAAKSESKPAVMKSDMPEKDAPGIKIMSKSVVQKQAEQQTQADEKAQAEQTAQQAQTAKTTDKQQKKQTEIIKYISGGKVNIRIRPDRNSIAVGQYARGEKVEVLEVISGWYRTDKGWVSAEYMSDGQGSEKTVKKQEKPKIIKCMYVSYKKANIRKEPTKNSKDMGDYDNGDKVCFYEIQDDWGRSDKGWVNLYNLKDVKCMEVSSKTLNVRKKASSNAKVIQVLKKGQQVCEYDRKNGWVYTGKGWVSGQFLK